MSDNDDWSDPPTPEKLPEPDSTRDNLDDDKDKSKKNLSEDLFGDDDDDDDDGDGGDQGKPTDQDREKEHQKMEMDVDEKSGPVKDGEEEKVTEEDLFGDSDDHDDDLEDRRRSRGVSEESADMAMADRVEKVIKDVAVPDIETPKGEGNDMFLIKLPNFLHVEPAPYDPETYEEEVEEDDDNDGRVKLKFANTLRWRYAPGEKSRSLEARKESNARFIRWSDGTMSLMLGSEFFDVNIQSLQDQFQYLVAIHRGQNLFQTQAKIEKKMAFRPFSTSSYTHKKLTASVLAKHQKMTRTKFHATVDDPNRLKVEAEKAEQEKLKNQRRLESKRRSVRNRYSSGWSVDGLEAEEFSDDEDEYYSRSKRTAASVRRDKGDYSEVEEEDEDEGGFVVDDEFVEMADDTDGDLPDSDDERDRRILSAKRGALDEVSHTETPESESVPNVDKRRRVVLSDDEDD